MEDKQRHIAGQYDAHYKRMFSHPEVVRDLLVGFVAGAREALDPGSLIDAQRNLVSEGGEARYADSIWQAHVHRRPVLVVIELQSTDEPMMALRMEVYVGLLLQTLKRAEKHQGKRRKKAKDDRRRLPCVCRS